MLPLKQKLKRFWKNLDRVVNSANNGYRLCVLGDLNRWVGDRVWVGITRRFGGPENDNGRMVIDFCAEKGISVNNTYFEHRSIHKYTRVARGKDEVEVKSMIDLVLVMKAMLC